MYTLMFDTLETPQYLNNINPYPQLLLALWIIMTHNSENHQIILMIKLYIRPMSWAARQKHTDMKSDNIYVTPTLCCNYNYNRNEHILMKAYAFLTLTSLQEYIFKYFELFFHIHILPGLEYRFHFPELWKTANKVLKKKKKSNKNIM